MKVTRLAVGVLEAEATLAEIDLAGDIGVDHPLQGAVNGRPADPLVFLADQIDEIVGAEVTFLTQEHPDDLFPLARPFAAGRLELGDIRKTGDHVVPVLTPV